MEVPTWNRFAHGGTVFCPAGSERIANYHRERPMDRRSCSLTGIMSRPHVHGTSLTAWFFEVSDEFRLRIGFESIDVKMETLELNLAKS